ncbi:hypothetical protein [Spirosoma gilvum]
MLNLLPVEKSVPANRQPSPLWVWLLTGVAALVVFSLLIALAFWSERQGADQFTHRVETVLQKEWAARADSITRVVVLGSSQVESGIADTAFFNGRCPQPIRVVKLFLYSANMEDFMNESPVVQLIERYPPDVLCLEENMVLFRLAHDEKPTPHNHFVEWINRHFMRQLQALKVRLGLARQTAPSFQGFHPSHFQSNQKDTLHLSQPLADIRSRPVRTETELPALSASLQRLHQQGTQVVLLNIPRPYPLETVIQGETRAPLLARLIANYRECCQVDYWRYPYSMPFCYYIDYAHLNHLGTSVYSAWLADQICLHTNTP